MNRSELQAIQQPIKQRYRDDPAAASIILRASGQLGENLSCSVQAGKALIEAGLHPATGGNGRQACSGDMLLEALVACAGVTLSAVATSMGIELRGGRLMAEGDLNFAGTLGISKEVPVGFGHIRLAIDLDSDAPAGQLEKLIELTERYCVVYQTLKASPRLELTMDVANGSSR